MTVDSNAHFLANLFLNALKRSKTFKNTILDNV